MEITRPNNVHNPRVRVRVRYAHGGWRGGPVRSGAVCEGYDYAPSRIGTYGRGRLVIDGYPGPRRSCQNVAPAGARAHGGAAKVVGVNRSVDGKSYWKYGND